MDTSDSKNGADIDGDYRYVLWRDTEHEPVHPLRGVVLWVMLNPSVADARMDDPTIRKVKGFSRRWDFQSFRVVNLFALRSTNPKALLIHPTPIGPRNDEIILREAATASAIVLAWGANADPLSSPIHMRAIAVRRMLFAQNDDVPIWTLGETKRGQPKHPLMLAYETTRCEA